MRKTGLFLIFIFSALIVIPVIMIKGLFWQSAESDIIFKVHNHLENKVVVMELEDYIRGVVAAEMPARYHLEALKAQAVAARTYAIKQLPAYGGNGSQAYPGADLSTDYRYCQAWISQNDMKERWGFISFFYYWARVNRAVEETKGEVLLYNGQLIDAVYHANSGGYTENARHVWGNEKPYLQSVVSPYDQESSNYQSTFYFALNELLEKLKVNSAQGDIALDIIETTKTGTVVQMKVGEHIFTGKEVRQLLNLPSAKFIVTQENKIVKFQLLGKGHGAGMSQDGANGYAKHGYSYRQILNHYYPGTKLGRLKH